MVIYVDINDFIRDSIAKNEREARDLLLRKKQDQISKIQDKSGLGKRFQKRTFDSFNSAVNRNAFSDACYFADNFPNVRRGLLLQGPVGVGKTHLAAAIANTLVGKLYTVMFGNIVDVIALIKNSYGLKSDLSELEIINAFTREADLLILDDLGKENPSPNTSAVLYQIVNRIYEDEKPMIITTNFQGEQLTKRLGERGEAIVSRITEMCQPVSMAGPDRRLREV